MIWPPVKAWTRQTPVEGKVHFVAINYGGKLLNRWVIMMSVIDSSNVQKVSYSHLSDLSHWKCGWNKNNDSNLFKSTEDKNQRKNIHSIEPSIDSGLTVPITKKIIRPWFDDI